MLSKTYTTSQNEVEVLQVFSNENKNNKLLVITIFSPSYLHILEMGKKKNTSQGPWKHSHKLRH